MKRNIGNLVIIAIIIVVAPFMMAAMESAAQPIPQTIRGQYAATGSSTQLVAICGFDPNYIPNYAAAGAWTIQAVSIQAVYTFKPDGTGTVSSMRRVVTHYAIGSAQAGLTPWAGNSTGSFSFHYTIEQNGKIEITADPGTVISTWISGPSNGLTSQITPLTYEGTISSDGKTIILNSGLPEVATISPRFGYCGGQDLEPQVIGNTSLVLIWRHDEDQP